MKRLLLAGLFLLLIQCSHASGGAFDDLDATVRQSSSHFSVDVSSTAARYSAATAPTDELKADDSHFAGVVPTVAALVSKENDLQSAVVQEDPPTQCQLCLPWFEMTLGTILEVSGAAAAAAGSVILLTWNTSTDTTNLANPTNTTSPAASTSSTDIMMTVGAAMATIGAFTERAGSLLTLRADHEAAKVERLLNEHVRKLTTEDLTPEQEELLSSAFYGHSESFMRFADCANCFDKTASVICKLFGAPLGLAGIGISKSMGSDNIAGTCVSAVGAALYKLGDFYGKKAEKRTKQLKMIAQINAAKGKEIV